MEKLIIIMLAINFFVMLTCLWLVIREVVCIHGHVTSGEKVEYEKDAE